MSFRWRSVSWLSAKAN